MDSFSLFLHLPRFHAVLQYSTLPQFLMFLNQKYVVLYIPTIDTLNSFGLTLYGSAKKCCVSESIYSLMHS